MSGNNDVMVTITLTIGRGCRVRLAKLTLEKPFWRVLGELIGQTPEALDIYLDQIDRARPAGVGLASAVRVDVLQRLQAQSRSERELAA